MSGKEERQLQLTSQEQSSLRIKVVLGVVVCLCVLSAVAAVAAVVTVTTGSNSPNNRDEVAHPVARSAEPLPAEDDLSDLEIDSEGEIQFETAGRNRRSTINQNRRRRSTTNTNDRMASCLPIDSVSNESVPAAHIKGHGGKFHPPTLASITENSLAPHGYQQSWKCNEFGENDNPQHSAHAFVDGGMIFNQTDKSLRVPECGYYHVFSQVYFQLERTTHDKSVSVKHFMHIERNCPSWPEQNAVLLQAKASVGPFDGSSGSSAVTTYTSDVIRLCKDGRIWVEISDADVPCCPMGDEHGTFIGAVLVSKTNCHWPPPMEVMNLQE